MERYPEILGRKGNIAPYSYSLDAFFGSDALERNSALPGISGPTLFFAQAILCRV